MSEAYGDQPNQIVQHIETAEENANQGLANLDWHKRSNVPNLTLPCT